MDTTDIVFSSLLVGTATQPLPIRGRTLHIRTARTVVTCVLSDNLTYFTTTVVRLQALFLFLEKLFRKCLVEILKSWKIDGIISEIKRRCWE